MQYNKSLMVQNWRRGGSGGGGGGGGAQMKWGVCVGLCLSALYTVYDIGNQSLFVGSMRKIN